MVVPPTTLEYGSSNHRVFSNLKNLMVGIMSTKVLIGIGSFDSNGIQVDLSHIELSYEA